MLAIGTILHPTDFSPQALHAFDVACALARDNGARLVVMYVEPPLVPSMGGTAGVPLLPSDYDHALMFQHLHELRSPDPSLAIEYRLEHGDQAPVIGEIAQEIGAGLIVMGTHGRSWIRRLLMGSVAEEVVRQAPCPVLTIRTPMHAEVAQHALHEVGAPM